MSKHIGLIIFLAIAVFASLLFALDLRDSVVVPLLSSSLNLIFRVGALFVVAYISARSYLKSGLFQQLLIGSSMIAFGAGSLFNAASSLFLADWINFALSITNISFFVFAALNVVSAFFLVYKRSSFELKPQKLKLNILLGYFAACLLMVVLAWMILAGVIPPFTVGREYTLARSFTLIGTVALFILGAAAMGGVYFESKSKILYWYSLGLSLHVVSVSALLLAPSPGSALSWLGSAAQCIGSIFFVAALFMGFKETNGVSGWSEAFRRDKRQFNFLFSNMNDGFAYHKIILDKQGNPADYVFLEVNDAFERATGLKRETVLHRKATEVIPGIEKDPADWIGVYGKVALTGMPVKFENYSQALNKWYAVSAYSSERGYFAVTFDDITDRKNAEIAIRESDERLRFATESVGIGLWDIDLVDQTAFRSLAHDRIFGYSEMLPQWTLDDFLKHALPEYREEVATMVREATVAKRGWTYECQIQRADGEIRWIWFSGRHYVAPSGHSRVAGVVQDITERKKAEEALSKLNEELEVKVQKRTEEVSNERQRLYNVLETLPAYVILLDKNYCVPFANKVFRERFGESTGKPCYDFLFNRTSPCENCETYKVLKTNSPHHWEWTGPDKRDYDIYDFPFTETDGSTIILEMGIDITERKKLEKQVKDSERLAAIGATAGMVGHDIRNPLHAITGDVYLAKSDIASLPEGETKASLQESVDAIEKNVDYINKIVTDLQDYARPLKPVPQETAIEPVVSGLLHRKDIPENIKASFRIDKDAQNLTVDPDCLKRILGNLVTNAVQAMPDGGKLTVHAHKDKQNGDAIVDVKDMGVGIPEDVKGKLFTPMFTTKSKGQGFGLAVVKRMTEALGGNVTFESQEGKGTTFTIRIPQNQQQQLPKKRIPQTKANSGE